MEMTVRTAKRGTARAHFYECTCAASTFTARPLCSTPLLLCIALVVFVKRVTATLQNKFRSLASFPPLAYSLASMHFVRLEEIREPDITWPPFPPVLTVSLFRFSLINFTFSDLTLFSKFYFNFPSQYLFAIGFTALFSVRSQLPPIINFTQQSQAVLLSSLQSISYVCMRVRTRLSLSMAWFSNQLGSLNNRLLCPPINYNSRTAWSIRDFNCALSVLFTRRY